MKALTIFILAVFSVFDGAVAQSIKRSDSVAFLQRVADSLSGSRTLSKNVDTLYHIVGSQYLKHGRDSIAARYLLRVRYDNQQKFNELGTAFSRIRRREDSSFMFFRKAADANVANNGKKNAEYAFTCKNLGDQFVSKRDLDSGLIYYQQAVVNLVDDFNEADLQLNPFEFARNKVPREELYQVLLLKAKTLVKRFNADGKVNDLVSALYTYSSLGRLAPDSISGFEPVDVSVKLYELTGDEVFLRHALAFATGHNDIKKLQTEIPADHAVLAYEVGDTTLIGIYLGRNKVLSSRASVDTTFDASKLSKDNLYKQLISPFSKEVSDKSNLYILRGQKLSNIKFESLFDGSRVINYSPPGTLEKEKKYSYLIWVMIAVVLVLAVIVIKKIR